MPPLQPIFLPSLTRQTDISLETWIFGAGVGGRKIATRAARFGGMAQLRAPGAGGKSASTLGRTRSIASSGGSGRLGGASVEQTKRESRQLLHLDERRKQGITKQRRVRAHSVQL